MSNRPFSLKRFWLELKRRRVVNVTTVYISASLVIIELINNLTEPFNLPTQLFTIVVIVLAVGLPLAIILSWLFDLTSKGVERTRPLSEDEEAGAKAVPGAWRIATIISFVVIAGLIVLNIVGINNQAFAGTVKSMVILPFSNYTGDDQLEYFVSGMHSSMIGGMGQVSGLRVVGETSSNAYKDADKPLVAIVRELNVDAALESTVMCLGDSICLQVKLIGDFPEEKQLWVGNFKVPKSDIMGLNSQIVKKIADETKIKLKPEELEQLLNVRRHQPDLLEACYKGRFHMNQLTEEGVELGIKFYNDAIAIDSTDYMPYLGLALGYSLTGHLSGVVPDAGERAIENAHKALALDSTLAEAYVVLATKPLYTDWDFDEAERYLLRALELNQNIAIAHYHLGWLRMLGDDLEGAVAEFKISVEIEPMDVTYPNNLAAIYGWIGQYEEALKIVEEALELNPGHPGALSTLGAAYSGLGMYEEAIATQERVQTIAEGYENGLGVAYALSGQRDKALEIIDKLKSYGYSYFYWGIADVYAALGEYDSAIHWIDECYNARQDYFPWFKNYVMFQPMFNDPRFTEIINRIDYPE
jgi:tetratricopeptide (TPR) repeat protein